jgi:hypothetical protein
LPGEAPLQLAVHLIYTVQESALGRSLRRADTDAEVTMWSATLTGRHEQRQREGTDHEERSRPGLTLKP